MTWLTWRQHRAQAWAGLALVVASAAIFVPFGRSIRNAYSADRIGACLLGGTAGDGCQASMSAFMDQFNGVANHLLTWFTPLPGLIGGIVGASVLGREYEHGTWRLAWTQAVPRTRWLAARIAWLVAGITMLTLSLSAIFTWFRSPVDQVSGKFAPGAFDLEGLTLTSYTLFAFGLGVFAGQLLRRTMPAAVVAFTGFIAVRIPVELWLRQRYLPPVTHLVPTASPRVGPTSIPVQPGAPGWLLSRDLVDQAGHPLSAAAQARIGQQPSLALRDATAHALGAQFKVVYQPIGRFWTFQLIEASLFVGLATALLATTLWHLRRHRAA